MTPEEKQKLVEFLQRAHTEISADGLIPTIDELLERLEEEEED